MNIQDKTSKEIKIFYAFVDAINEQRIDKIYSLDRSPAYLFQCV